MNQPHHRGDQSYRFFAERPLSIVAFIASCALGGVVVALGIPLAISLATHSGGLLIFLVFCGSFPLSVALQLYSASSASRFLEFNDDQVAYPIPSRAGLYLRRLKNQQVTCPRRWNRFLLLRFAGGLPYVFPRFYQRPGDDGRSQRFEIAVEAGRLQMIQASIRPE